MDSYEEPLWNLVDQFQDTIVSLYFGHSHQDSFFVMKDFDTNTEPVAIAYVAPSVTTYKNKNPAFRVCEYNRTTFEMINYHQYILNLTDANISGTPNWYKEYDPKTTYNMKALTPKDWLEVVGKMDVDQNMLNTFQYYRTCSYGTMGSCTGSCKTDTLCQLQSSTAAVQNECNGDIPGPGLSTFINRFCPSWWSP